MSEFDDAVRAGMAMLNAQPANIDRPRDYAVVLHPSQVHHLREWEVRTDWHWRRHVERWERRYGRPHPTTEAEVSILEGFRFIESVKA